MCGGRAKRFKRAHVSAIIFRIYSPYCITVYCYYYYRRHHARASEDDELRQVDRDTHVKDDEDQRLEDAHREEVRRQTGKSTTILRRQTGNILSSTRLVVVL